MRKFLIGLVALAVIGGGCSNDDGAGASGPTGAGRTRHPRNLFLLAGIAPVPVDLFAARRADIESFPRDLAPAAYPLSQGHPRTSGPASPSPLVHHRP